MLILSNTDFIILCIISFHAPVSGYRINQIADAEFFRFWIDIGQSSVYSRLKLLERKRLITVDPNAKKSGKGPRPNLYLLTELGKRTLDYRIIEFLSDPDPNGRRFDLGIFAISLIQNKQLICETLLRRIQSLHAKAEELNRSVSNLNSNEHDTTQPLNSDLLLKHVLSQIKAEIDFSHQVIDRLGK